MVMEPADRTRVAVWYAVWATACGAVAGIVVLLFDTYLFSHLVHRAAVYRNLLEEGGGVLAIAAGQGAVVLVTSGALLQFGRALNATVLLGLLIGVFDFVFDLLQVFVPSLEVDWTWKLIIGLAAGLAITIAGSSKDKTT
jgi:hypothetical protein